MIVRGRLFDGAMDDGDRLVLCRAALRRCRHGDGDLVSALETLRRALPFPGGSHHHRHEDPHLAAKRRLRAEAVVVVAEMCAGDPAAPALVVALPLLGSISRDADHHRLFLDRFGHPDPRVRAAAALGLVRLNLYAYPPPIHEPLLDLLDDDPAAHVRASVARILWLVDRPYGRPASGLPRRLLTVALHDPDPGVRAAAFDEIERYCRLGNAFACEHMSLIGRSPAHPPPSGPYQEPVAPPDDDPWAPPKR
ncbi:hypothetical protein [Thermomonospora cellulosilytica]|uniref:HEAT repeat protein n=1 Tax=Thermomonospora cellulosilytica TaxID=1411118 RepID=A0A7W3MYP4_9ACTN|nr:hypothetical protein [Thermomonospora cellulosilytica]MBA9004332.1 hypothetical protein [Thermomonospora cellulosilytica]